MRRIRRFLPVALVVAIALPLVGCPLIVLKLCVKNETAYDLVELNISPVGDSAWGDNWLTSSIVGGASDCVNGIEPGTYDMRALFDTKGDLKALETWTSGNVGDAATNAWSRTKGPIMFKSVNKMIQFLYDGANFYAPELTDYL